MALKVYLADLTHIGKGIATEGFPLNIGVVASYAKHRLGDAIDIRLFKYPQHLKQVLLDEPPHVLGCSNYVWNSNLSYYFAKLAKSVDRNIVTVFGGTNYPFSATLGGEFLKKRPDIDFHLYYEGEQAFVHLLEHILGSSGYDAIKSAAIPGCHSLDPAREVFLAGPEIPRLKTLDEIPSPYVNGLLDKFFDGILTPLVETARGCPFRCNFCNAGHDYYNKVNKFSDEYVREEMTYIAQKASAANMWHVTIVDNNFGMVPRDAKTARLLHELQGTYGWPRSISAWTGKNAKERVIDVTRLLTSTISISMSVQSMDPLVLQEIKRDNIKLDHFKAITDELNQQGRPQHAEVIMPLPGETLASHLQGLKDLVDTGVRAVMSHTLQMLHGTPYMDDPAYIERYGYVTRYRVVPLDFSKLDGDCIFDFEEVGVATKSLSFEDYLEARRFLLMLDLCYNQGTFVALRRYIADRGMKMSTWVEEIYGRMHKFPPKVRAVIDSFSAETASELWTDDKDLVRHYEQPENYQRLVDGEAGGNVLYRHRAWMLASAVDWVAAVFDASRELLTATTDASEMSAMLAELAALRSFTELSVTDYFEPDSLETVLNGDFSYDIRAWLADTSGRSLDEFTLFAPVRWSFRIDKRSREVMADGFVRYGTHLSGKVKLMQRVGPQLRFCREVVEIDQDVGNAPPPLATAAGLTKAYKFYE